MLKIVGNRQAVYTLNCYINKKMCANLTLQGPRGVGKYTAARQIACELLGTTEEKLDIHPDSMIYSEEEPLKVEDISNIIEFTSLMPIKGDKKVILIDNAEKMSEAVQNKLLKSVEDNGNNVFIFVTSRELLGTIHSRTFNVAFQSLTEEELLEYIESKGETPPMPLGLYDGSVGRYEMLKSNDYLITTVSKLVTTFQELKDKSEFLEIFHEMKEKDKYEFYTMQKENTEMVIGFIKKIFSEVYFHKKYGEQGSIDLECLSRSYSLEQVERIIEKCKNDQYICRDNRYTKNDFFLLVALLTL